MRKTKGPYGSRQEAVAKALALNPRARFYDGFPCKHGHPGVRYIKDGHCQQCKEVLYAKRLSKKGGLRIF